MTASKRPQKLADIQKIMAQALMRPLASQDRMQQTWVDGSPTAQVASEFIKPNDRLSSFERLQIYNQQYWWRLLASFAEDYNGLRAVLGPRKFDKLAVAYIETWGSQSWTMRNLGRQLEDFLRAHPELTAPHTALALDLARVEWARVIAFDGPDKPVVQPESIAGIPADRLHLELQPYITLLELAHPVDELLLKLKESEIETGAFSNAVASDHSSRRTQRIKSRPSAEPVHLAVHRYQLSVYYKRLDREAYLLLLALKDGMPLEEACAVAFADSKNLPAHDAARIQQWFATWMRLGWFAAKGRK
jgi:Putative DNA-binding domain